VGGPHQSHVQPKGGEEKLFLAWVVYRLSPERETQKGGQELFPLLGHFVGGERAKKAEKKAGFCWAGFKRGKRAVWATNCLTSKSGVATGGLDPSCEQQQG